MVYQCAHGDPAGIEALENKRTFIEFLSTINLFLEKVRLEIEYHEKNKPKT